MNSILALALTMITVALGVEDAGGEITLEDFRVGHWVEVRGHLDGERFVAQKVELHQPMPLDLLIGQVANPNDQRFFVLGQEVKVSKKTKWKRFRVSPLPRALEGERVKVEGHYRGPRNFSSRSVSPRGPGRDRVGARIDQVRNHGSGVVLTLMGFEVLVQPSTEIVSELPLEDIRLADARPVGLSAGMERRRGVDEDDLLGTGFELFPGVRVNGQLEAEVVDESDYDLDGASDEDRRDVEASSRARITWRLDDGVALVAEGRFRQRWRADEKDGRSSQGRWTLGETFAWWGQLAGGPLDLLVGRQDFDDPREWIYDQNLDAVRAIYAAPSLRVELSVSTTLGGGRERDEEATNLIGYVSNGGDDQHLAAWVVARDYDLGIDESLTHFGARAIGAWWDGHDSWFELSGVRGDQGSQDVAGWAYDVGTTWIPGSLPAVSLTAGYAFGSGDDDLSDGTDTAYRQTGLQDNNGKFAGVTSFRYYGELFDPELANLGVLTLGVGFRLARSTSLDLVFHHYRQDHVAVGPFGSDLDARTNGTDGDLGWEVDAIFGSRHWENWHLELVGSWFRPGAAFNDDHDAYLARIQLRYRF